MSRPAALVIFSIKLAGAAIFFFTPHGMAAALLFFGPDLFVFYQIFVPRARILCHVHNRFRSDGAQVWLTIDDGPDPDDTPRILELLARHQARATFFVIGERAAKHPELLAEILKRGHELGCHTHTHPAGSFWAASPARVRREIDLALAVIRRAGGSPRWFRAPVGIKNFFLPRTLRERGLGCVGWEVRSYDCLARRPENVTARVMRQVRPGSIILMHEGRSVPAAVRITALTQVLQSLTDAGFSCILPNADQLD